MEDLMQILSDYLPHIVSGLAASAVTAFALIHRSCVRRTRPEPGVFYHNGVFPESISRFKKIATDYTEEKVESVSVVMRNPMANDKSGLELVSGLFEKALEEQAYLIELAGVRLAYVGEDVMEDLEEGFNSYKKSRTLSLPSPSLRELIEGKRVLVHWWGSKAMAISTLGHHAPINQ